MHRWRWALFQLVALPMISVTGHAADISVPQPAAIPSYPAIMTAPPPENATTSGITPSRLPAPATSQMPSIPISDGSFPSLGSASGPPSAALIYGCRHANGSCLLLVEQTLQMGAACGCEISGQIVYGQTTQAMP